MSWSNRIKSMHKQGRGSKKRLYSGKYFRAYEDNPSYLIFVNGTDYNPVEFQKELLDYFNCYNGQEMIIDLSNISKADRESIRKSCNYSFSSFIKVLTKARKNKRNISFRGVSGTLEGMLQLTKLDKILPVNHQPA
jgi:anti-anti-sigma regulatory factor